MIIIYIFIIDLYLEVGSRSEVEQSEQRRVPRRRRNHRRCGLAEGFDRGCWAGFKLLCRKVYMHRYVLSARPVLSTMILRPRSRISSVLEHKLEMVPPGMHGSSALREICSILPSRRRIDAIRSVCRNAARFVKLGGGYMAPESSFPIKQGEEIAG